MSVDLSKLLMKYPELKLHPSMDAVEGHCVILQDQLFIYEVMVSREGDVCIFKNTDYNNELVLWETYTSQEELEKDLDIFMSTFKKA